ncbi:hypothetical protein SUGI_0851230 [Cryptomeria japonica]|nr:hypothetical protein SUGI_0851230 [Cryptomeria japonica]
MAVLAEEKTTERGRLIARLATLLIRYAHPLSVLSCLAGLIALLLLPLLAKNTYISENALIPGSSNARYSNQEAKEANDLAKEILALKLSSMQNPVAIQSLLMQHMYETAEDVYFHNFLPPVNTFEPSSFFIDSSYSKRKEFKSINSSALGVNVVGIIRAPHGDGKEAIVLVTPFRSDNVDIGDALSLGLGFSLFRMFSRTIWLAKDIVWLAADSKYGAYAAVAAWLKDYHEPVFYYSSEFLKSSSPINSQNPAETKKLTFKQINYKKAGDFQRAGTIAAGLVFQVKETGIQIDKDRLDIYAEGCNGQMPNLDLINVVNFLAVHRQGLQVRVDSISHMLSWEWLACLGRMLEWLGNVVGGLNPGWKFGLSAFEYLHGAATLASSIYHQALGIPTGAHGAFRDYQVDAITLKMSPQFFLENETARMSFLLKLGRLLEGVVRSVNNLLEKFHQSFFLYFLTASSRFVSVGVYMIPFALLVVPLMILAASLCSYKHDSLSTFSKSDDKSGPLKHHEPESEVALRGDGDFDDANVAHGGYDDAEEAAHADAISSYVDLLWADDDQPTERMDHTTSLKNRHHVTSTPRDVGAHLWVLRVAPRWAFGLFDGASHVHLRPSVTLPTSHVNTTTSIGMAMGLSQMQPLTMSFADLTTTTFLVHDSGPPRTSEGIVEHGRMEGGDTDIAHTQDGASQDHVQQGDSSQPPSRGVKRTADEMHASS